MSEPKSITNLWMVPYADLMSILMILFLGLFGFAYLERKAQYEQVIADMQKQFTPTVDERHHIDVLAKEVKVAQEIQDETRGEHTKLEITAHRIRVTFQSPILFNPGSADLKSEAVPDLQKVAKALKNIPNPVWVEGHTDDRPILSGHFKTNWELSAARAHAVVAYFIGQGLEPARFSILGYGQFRPVDSNASEEGRERNRRIEISILRQQS